MTQTAKTKIQRIAVSADGTEHLLAIVTEMPLRGGVNEMNILGYHLLWPQGVIEIAQEKAKKWIERNIENPAENIELPYSVEFGFIEYDGAENE